MGRTGNVLPQNIMTVAIFAAGIGKTGTEIDEANHKLLVIVAMSMLNC